MRNYLRRYKMAEKKVTLKTLDKKLDLVLAYLEAMEKE